MFTATEGTLFGVSVVATSPLACGQALFAVQVEPPEQP